MPLYFKDYPLFTPSLSPKEMFSMGIFGGTYFRPLKCKVTGKYLSQCHNQFEWAKEIPKDLLTSSEYDVKKNYYKVKCGSDYDFWVEKGWIKEPDLRGWVHWYCRFYEGRRSSDDKRQINRWYRLASLEKGRFRNAKKLTPKIKQVLLHWGIAPEEIC